MKTTTREVAKALVIAIRSVHTPDAQESVFGMLSELLMDGEMYSIQMERNACHLLSDLSAEILQAAS